jgi:anti-sigma factor RsiW
MERHAQHAFDAEEVMAYLDGELEAQRAAALAAHLEHCGECQEVAQGFRALSEKMLGLEREVPSARMSEVVLAGLDSRKPSREMIPDASDQKRWWERRRVFAKPYAWIAATALIAAAIIVLVIPNVLRTRLRPEDMRAPARPQSYALTEPAGSTLQSRNQEVATETSAAHLAAPVGAPPSSPVAHDKGLLHGLGNGSEEVISGDGQAVSDELHAPETVGPMIVQTASLNILATNYDEASGAVEKLAAAHGGYVEKLDAKAQIGNARGLTASLRIPTKQLDGFLADLRKLGHVEEETRSNEEVSNQYVDLQARLKSARATEQRLIELLGTRTGKLQDVLEAERELARIRGEIESMQGQSAMLVHRVNYATVEVDLSEEYRQVLGTGTVSTGTKIRNALVEGFSNLEEGAVALLVFLFAYGPSLLFWLAILLLPGWFAWKRFRARAQE